MLEFCPSCDNLYNFVEKTEQVGDKIETKLFLQCSSCNKENPFEGHCIKVGATFDSISKYQIVPEQCYDRTLPHTDSIKCQYQECPSNVDPMKNPANIVFFHANEDRVLAYICCICNHYWKND